MRNRKLHWALAVAFLACDLWLYMPWPSRVTRENFDQIQPGMTEEEVIRILGPAGDHRNRENDYDIAPAHQPAIVFGRGNPAGPTILWRGDSSDVGLGFATDKLGTRRVSTGIHCYMRPKSNNLLRNLLWRAGDRLHRLFSSP